MSWRNLCPHGLERATHRSAPVEENRQNDQDNGNLPNQGSRRRIRRGSVASQHASSFHNEANVNVASAASVGAAATARGNELMVPLYTGEVIRGGMLSAAGGTGEFAVPAAGAGASAVDPCQGEDSNGRGNLNRSRTPIRSGSRNLGESSTSNESSSAGRHPVMAIPEARRELIYRLLSSESCDCGEGNCPH